MSGPVQNKNIRSTGPDIFLYWAGPDKNFRFLNSHSDYHKAKLMGRKYFRHAPRRVTQTACKRRVTSSRRFSMDSTSKMPWLSFDLMTCLSKRSILRMVCCVFKILRKNAHIFASRILSSGIYNNAKSARPCDSYYWSVHWNDKCRYANSVSTFKWTSRRVIL